MERLPSLAALALAVAPAGCAQNVEPALDADAVSWVSYASIELGVAFDHPVAWTPVLRGNTVALQGHRAAAMRVTLADRREAERRGLWGRTPVLRVDTVGDLAFAFYRYRHYDGPAYVPTLAFVVEHRAKELGVEFRTRAEEPGPVERRVLESVRLR